MLLYLRSDVLYVTSKKIAEWLEKFWSSVEEDNLSQFQNNGVKHRSATFRPRLYNSIPGCFFAFEHGNDGKWVVISSEIKEVGPVAVKPIEEIKTHSFKTVLLNGSGPQPLAAWKTKVQSFKALGYKAGSNSKPISVEIQTSDLVSSDTVTRVPEVVSLNAISSFACNFAVQSCVAPSQPSISGCHEPGMGPSPLVGEYASEAYSSRLMSYQVLHGSGSLESLPSFAFGIDYGLPLSRELPVQPPPSTLGVGSSNSIRDTVRLGSKEGNSESSDPGSEPMVTKAPHNIGLRISDFVGDLSKT
nr:hypothetical protein CFP56_31220 [Quercus suber]